MSVRSAHKICTTFHTLFELVMSWFQNSSGSGLTLTIDFGFEVNGFATFEVFLVLG